MEGFRRYNLQVRIYSAK